MSRAKQATAAEDKPQHLRWTDIEEEWMNPTISRKLAVGKRAMLGFIKLKKGAIVPAHRHLSEQITFVLKGSLKFTIHGEDYIVKAGEILIIPSKVVHSAIALQDTDDFDCFSPLRHDWLSKKDSYLRTGRSCLRKKDRNR